MILFVQGLKIFANGNRRCLEVLGKILDEDPAVTVKDFENGTPAFFVEHYLLRGLPRTTGNSDRCDGNPLRFRNIAYCVAQYFDSLRSTFLLSLAGKVKRVFAWHAQPAGYCLADRVWRMAAFLRNVSTGWAGAIRRGELMNVAKRLIAKMVRAVISAISETGS
jgi:hypothetical protein